MDCEFNKMNEMKKLITLLVKNDIPFELGARTDPDLDHKRSEGLFDYELIATVQILVKGNQDEFIIDAVCHPGTYGWKDGLLEIMMDDRVWKHIFGEDSYPDVVGWADAERAFEYFKKAWDFMSTEN